ncbi:MAG: COX15/CtaA family protein [Acidimicrobiales bacterium]
MTSTPRFRVPPPKFRWFAFSSFLSMIVIVLTGGAVRLTGSGLGCPDWPTCYSHQITGSWSIHPLIEYTNRIVTIVLVIVTGVTFVAAWLRTERRRDLIGFSGLLVLGVVADAILGAFVVYSKLNPWLVSLHMILSLAMVVVGAILYHRSKYVYGPGTRADVRDPHFRLIARLLWIPFVLVLFAGTATTGSGPHAGAAQGQLVARRLPFAFADAAWVHSVLAVLFLGLVSGLVFAIWRSGVPDALRLGVRRLVIIALIQAIIGFVQYVTHVPVVLVELHIAGAVSLCIGVTQFHLRQTARDRVPGTKTVA